MKSLLLAALAFMAVALCVPQHAHAGVSAAAAPKRTRPPRHHSVIAAISADAISVQSGDQNKSYKITPNTEITFKGESAKVDDLKVGMRVSVTPDAIDDGTAGTITANDPPPPEPTPKPKK